MSEKKTLDRKFIEDITADANPGTRRISTADSLAADLHVDEAGDSILPLAELEKNWTKSFLEFREENDLSLNGLETTENELDFLRTYLEGKKRKGRRTTTEQLEKEKKGEAEGLTEQNAAERINELEALRTINLDILNPALSSIAEALYTELEEKLGGVPYMKRLKNIKGEDQKAKLKALLQKRVKDLAGIETGETAARAHVMAILLEIAEIFEFNDRQKIVSRRLLVNQKKKYESTDKTKQVQILRRIALIALFSYGTYTSWHFFCEFVDLMISGSWLPEDALIGDVLKATAAPISALMLSNIVASGKMYAEREGAVHETGRIETVKNIFHSHVLWALCFSAAIVADGFTTGVGNAETVVGKADSEDQINKAKAVALSDKEAIKSQLDDLDKYKPEQEGRKIGTQVLIDEYLGTYGTGSGTGPRFTALAASYFPGEPFSMLDAHAADPRCQISATGGDMYSGFQIVYLDDSVCAERKEVKNGPPSYLGWIVGSKANGGTTTDSILAARASDVDYEKAQEAVNLFRNAHPHGYAKEFATAWTPYANTVDETVGHDLEGIDTVMQEWEPTSSVLDPMADSRAKVDPLFNDIKNQADQAQLQLDQAIARLNADYSGLDADIIKELDPNGKIVQIKKPNYTTPNFTVAPVDVSGSFTLRRTDEKIGNVLSKHPIRFVAANFAFVMGLFLGVIDSLLAWESHQRANKRDSEALRSGSAKELGETLKEMMYGIDEALNHGPFRALLSEDGERVFSGDVIKERVIGVVARMAEARRSETVENGLLIGMLTQMRHVSLAVLWTELKTYLGALFTNESETVRAANRVNAAISEMAADPNLLTQEILGADVDGNHLSALEMLSALRESPGIIDGADLSDRFKREIGTEINKSEVSGKKDTEKEGRPEVVKEMDELLKRMQVLEARGLTEEESLLEYAELQKKVDHMEKLTILPGVETTKIEQIKTKQIALKGSFEAYLSAMLKVAENGLVEAEAAIRRERVANAKAVFDPIFETLERKVQMANVQLGKANYDKEIDLWKLPRRIHLLVETLEDVETKLRTLEPGIKELEERKTVIRVNCREGKVRLSGENDKYNKEIAPLIRKNRGVLLIDWIEQRNLLMSGEMNQEQAINFIQEFFKLYEKLYKGSEAFVQATVTASGLPDPIILSQAFGQMSGDIASNENSYGLHEGNKRRHDPVWKLANALKTAGKDLYPNFQIDVPEKLPEVRAIAQKI